MNERHSGWGEAPKGGGNKRVMGESNQYTDTFRYTCEAVKE